MVSAMKKHIITIAGKPGSGKSTTSNRLARELGYNRFSSGDLFRAIAKERGIDVLEINLTAETEQEIDHQVDDRLKDIGQNEDNLVIDSRMAWYWMPNSFRVYLDLDVEVAAERIVNGMDKTRMEAENIPSNPHEYAKLLQNRLDSESRRYMNLYEQNPYDTSNYDLVVDTAKNNPEEVVRIILEAYKNWIGE